MSKNFKYKCINCGNEYDNSVVRYLCPGCSNSNNPDFPPKGVLNVIYDYKDLKAEYPDFKSLRQRGFIDILPINSLQSLPKLKVGNTPLYEFSELENEKLNCSLFLKDDSQNPTFSFKDRASAIVSAFAKENNITTIVAASTGNAGSSLAGLCASQGQNAIIMVPSTAPLAKLIQIIMYGAKIIPVNGTYDDAFDLSIKATEKYGWYNRNTAFNPLTIEGKKNVSFELFEQLEHEIPDKIFVPVGDGAIISGVYKGFEELLELGFIDKIPTIIMVQSSGSDNMIRSIKNKEFKVKKSDTIADSISVDIPRNFYMTKMYIQKYAGEFLTVTDDEILSASKILSKNTGIFSEPAAATAFAGFISYRKSGKLPKNSKNVVLLTGSGLKDLNSVQGILNMPEAIEPDIECLVNVLIRNKRIATS